MNARIAENTPDINVAIMGISVLGFTLARNLKKKNTACLYQQRRVGWA